MTNLEGRVAVLTGGGGVLCTAIARGLSSAGATVVLYDLDEERAQRALATAVGDSGSGMALGGSVLVREDLDRAAAEIVKHFGQVDILINGAGGNHPEATTSADRPFFELPDESVRFVFDLNFQGTLVPSQVFGRLMADRGEGVILNIASMNAFRPLTRIPAYSAAKAAVANFTQWLAVYMAQNVSPKIRVNAIAPGFFLTEQNRFLLQGDDGELTERGRQILDHTPMARFGDPEDLVTTVLWLVSAGSEFVHGIVVPVDGGFSAYSGV
ncbi:MAG: SDR family oxidoreductase [Candidatus Bipolaricaulota bacterium]|nr:MAG: SDR family oxidoreductase [Candidatus Bipolaricaulota bacterium]